MTDPPFFDNVHYSELADFFHAWQQLGKSPVEGTTRNVREVQDTDADRFSEKLRAVFAECERILKDDGLLIFTYHHSRNEGWRALAEAVLGVRRDTVRMRGLLSWKAEKWRWWDHSTGSASSGRPPSAATRTISADPMHPQSA